MYAVAKYLRMKFASLHNPKNEKATGVDKIPHEVYENSALWINIHYKIFKKLENERERMPTNMGNSYHFPHIKWQ